MVVKQAANILSEKTLLPLSLVFGLISATAWITALSSDQKRTAEIAEKLAHQQELTNTLLSRVDERLSQLEGRLAPSPPRPLLRGD